MILFHRIIGYSKLEGTCKHHQVQTTAPYKTTQNSNSMSENTVQMYTELQQLRAVITALMNLCHAPRPLVENLFLTLSLTISWLSSIPFPTCSFESCYCHQGAEISTVPPLPLPWAHPSVYSKLKSCFKLFSTGLKYHHYSSTDLLYDFAYQCNYSSETL